MAALNTNLTENELKALKVLVADCLRGMGGSRPLDLDSDPYTWTDAKTLMAAGWDRHSANSTFGHLMSKGFVCQYDKNEWCVTDDGYRFAETIWDN